MEGTVVLTLVGRKKFLKKDKSGYCFMVSALRKYEADEMENGNFGSAVQENYVPEGAWYELKESDVGKEFIYDYGMGKYGKPEITGIIFANTK